MTPPKTVSPPEPESGDYFNEKNANGSRVTCDPQIGSFVVGAGLGLKTGRLAADIPKKVEKTSGDSLGFQKKDDPSHEFGRFCKKN